MQTLKVKYKSTNTIKPHKNNPRKHLSKHIAEIKTSIHQFGFSNPILLDRMMKLSLDMAEREGLGEALTERIISTSHPPRRNVKKRFQSIVFYQWILPSPPCKREGDIESRQRFK
jgi:hypothetical protein